MTDSAQYSIGIDLGTTHCVLSYVSLTKDSDKKVHVLDIPQLVLPGVIEGRTQLPSFIYSAHADELDDSALALPWDASPESITGTLARHLGQKTPLRLVASAKSWLCHDGVDQHSDFLPLASPDEVDKISPLEATFEYLQHLKNAWEYQFPDAPLISQSVTITIPASFAPAARELTAEAANFVGFENLTLLEEPQAAVYNWLHSQGDRWRDQVSVGEVILVVDIGGGTTDLSLLAVKEDNGQLCLDRIAVGDHILLGGDNMDLALAYKIKAKLETQGKTIEPWQIQGITQACRDAKEQLLLDNDIDNIPITIPSRGSKFIGSTLRSELTREEVKTLLIEGFFPAQSIDQHPQTQRRSALSQKRLAYAQDPAITRHLAAFLCRQTHAADDVIQDPLVNIKHDGFIKPSAILFNGGVLKSHKIEQHLLDVINQWLADAEAPAARLLEDCNVDLAVANGASYFGFIRENGGVRIRGGLASAFYIGIESAMPAIPGMEAPLEALCVAPFGMEEGSELPTIQQEFGIIIGEPVYFRFFGSSVRRHDEAGTVLQHWSESELEELPEIQATLEAEGMSKGSIVSVYLSAKVNDVGILTLEAIAKDDIVSDNPRRWHIELNVRNASANPL